jgi:hypothetical protein
VKLRDRRDKREGRVAQVTPAVLLVSPFEHSEE